MQQIPVSQQIEQLRAQLVEAFVERDDAEKRLKAAEERINAIRNVMAGIGLGQALQQEIDAASAPQPEAKKE